MRKCAVAAFGLLLGLGGPWVLKPAPADDPDTQPVRPEARFFSLPGRPYHVVYVVDCSGSMLGCFDVVRREVLASIARLKANQQFQVIGFGGRVVEPEAAKLVEASQANKIKAAEFTQAIQPQGTSDPTAAIERAFEVLAGASRKPGKILYLLSDSDFADNDEVLAAVRRLNEKSGVVISTVQFGRRSTDAGSVLKTIAQENDGKYRVILLMQEGGKRAASGPASAGGEPDAFTALVRQAVRKKPEGTAFMGGQRPTGLDFSGILTRTGQDEALARFPEERRGQEEAISILAGEHKTWALAALLDHGDVDVKIRSARALAGLTDPRAVPALLAAAKANDYPVRGSESATVHSNYRRTLKAGLEKITGLDLTPDGLQITEYPTSGEPPVITSDEQHGRFPEEVDFARVEAWLAEKYLATASTRRAASARQPAETQPTP